MTPLRRLKRLVKSALLDIGPARSVVFVAGMARSGTTWCGDLLNHRDEHRVMFEPFHNGFVSRAREFDYIPYLRRDARRPRLARHALAILAGRVRGEWVERDTRRWLYRSRLIKDVRCNLMLAWLKQQAPWLPVVLLVRHPLQIYLSWKALGFGGPDDRGRNDFEIITASAELLADFPEAAALLPSLDPASLLDRVLFQWCLFVRVPLATLRPGEFHLMFYEDLVVRPETSVPALFAYLGRSDAAEAVAASRRASSTNFNQRDVRADAQEMATGWKRKTSAEDQARCAEILRAFGLDHLYGPDGLPASAAATSRPAHA